MDPPELRLFRMTNASREAHDKPPLTRAARLTDLAEAHSRLMARENALRHSGVRPKGCAAWAENIGVTGGAVRHLHQAFMASKPHRDNILGHYQTVGVGLVRDDAGRLWGTVIFCRAP